MECMCAQTRPQFVLSSERPLGNGVRNQNADILLLSLFCVHLAVDAFSHSLMACMSHSSRDYREQHRQATKDGES